MRVSNSNRAPQHWFSESDMVLVYRPTDHPTLPLMPAHAVLLDPSQRSIVLAIRGTASYGELLRDVCGVAKAQPTLPSGAFAHKGIAAFVDSLCSEEYFQASCAGLTLGGSELFPARSSPFGARAPGILALLQRLIDLSAE
jgi:hypothetical protein